MKKILALALLALSTSVSVADDKFQACTGLLVREDQSLLLKPDPSNESPWCDAYISEDIVEDTNQVSKVLAACTVGQKCRIEGHFIGRGVFYWTRITKATAQNESSTEPYYVEYLGFHTPSGNIYCDNKVINGVLQENFECIIGDTAQKKCETMRTFQISRESTSGVDVCQPWQDDEAPTTAPTLGYGSSWQLDGISCEIQEAGVTCKNQQGHGFFISHIQQKVF